MTAADATAKDVKTKRSCYVTIRVCLKLLRPRLMRSSDKSAQGARVSMGNGMAQGGKGPSKEQAEAAQKERAEKNRWAAFAAGWRPRM